MAVNTLSLCFTATPPPPPSSSCTSCKPQFVAGAKRFVPSSSATFSSSSSGHFAHLCLGAIVLDHFSSSSLLTGRSSKAGVCTALAAVVDEEAVAAEGVDGGEHVEGENDGVSEEERWKLAKATEVYVCNLPRSCDTEQLLHMFEPHGTILSVEVCRNAETGESKGCAYVTMGSINSARNAVAALDGSDVGGREMRVRFSVEMNPRRRNVETMNSSPKRVTYYEGPYKLYVGNLARAVRPEDLRHLFGRFGTVASVRVLQDQKQGKSRVYAFVSFLSERERDKAMSLHGTELCGRTLVVREGVERTET